VNVSRDVPGLDGAAREQVYSHVFGNADREVGGVLVGRVAHEGSVPLVTASIAAISADEHRSTLTFTQDAWEHVHRVLERDHPDDQIVGWYHSHPGFGIFLSEDDLFIHRNFFSGSSQIALVVDPLRGIEGVFGWDGGAVSQWYERSTACPGLGVARGAETPGDAPPPSPSPSPSPSRPRSIVIREQASGALHASGTPPLVLLVALVVGIIVGLALWEGALRGERTRAAPPVRSVTLPAAAPPAQTLPPASGATQPATGVPAQPPPATPVAPPSAAGAPLPGPTGPG
jgi:proteasome lid subunit RPN8/RPN11